MINSWDIDLTWHKKRNYPFKKADEVILPHYLTLPPFPGAPIERARCFFRHDFKGRMNCRDFFYMLKSRFLWLCWYENLDSPKRKIEKKYYDCKIIGSDCFSHIKMFPSRVGETCYFLTKGCYTLSKLLVYRLLIAVLRFR